MSSWLLFVALSLSVYRVWRLVGKDDITAPIRDKLGTGWVRQGAECPWCLGTWLSIASVYATHRWLVVLRPHWLLWAVGVACVVGLIGNVDS